jgi:tetratricopeptide (TPR) repeat protein
MSESPERELPRIANLLKERNFDEAASACRDILSRSPRNAMVTHLLGLARKDAGHIDEGERLIRHSIELEPRNGEFRSNLANLLKRKGQLRDAVQVYREALTLFPAHRAARLGLAQTLHELGEFAAAEAECRVLLADASEAPVLTTLAMTLRQQHRFAEAEAAYRAAIAVSPNHAIAHHNLGSLMSQLERAEEALAALDRAAALGVSGFELAFNRGRALVQLYRPAEAEQAFARAVAANPTHVEAQLNLARLRFIQGDPAFARDIIGAANAAPDNLALHILFANVLRRSGDLATAESLLRRWIERMGPHPDARVALAQVLHETARLRDAENEAMEAAIARPGDAGAAETLVAILLSRGRPEDALPFIRAFRERSPHEQGWIAYEATARRLLGDAAYRELYDYARVVRTYDIGAPAGWRSVREFNDALQDVLNQRHPFVNHPLDQSLRNGSQTARSLLTEANPIIRALLKAFQEPIADYRRAIGTDARHPLSARNSGASRYAGAWSVQLRRGGFHVNHVHPAGWISSAYYVHVPREVEDANLMSGWLKFGETRLPVPGATPEVFVQPVVGRLVLFPSYMWHGTNAIYGGETRTTVAFDVVPQPTEHK